MIFKKNRFSESAMTMLDFARGIASAFNEEKTRCSHLLAAITCLAPEIVNDILGKDISGWIKEYKITLDLKRITSPESEYADELCTLLLDTSEESPLAFIRSYFPDDILTPAELAFIVLKEATGEITDILKQYNFVNDSRKLEDKICMNYLACREKHSASTVRERLKKCVEMGKKFSAFMKERIVGQDQAIEAVTTALINFWHNGNQHKPLAILLLAQTGGGKSFFVETMQKAFIELGLQNGIFPALDMSCFTHNEATDAELLGENQSYRCAQPGKIYQISQENHRGIFAFENINAGCRSARRILAALTQNAGYDKYFEKNVNLPFNVLLFTLTLSESQYDFLKKHGTDKLDAQNLIRILMEKDQDHDAQSDFSLINSVQEFVCLAELDKEQLEKIVRNKFDTLQNELQTGYQVALDIPESDNIVELMLQSLPHTVTPKELVAIMSRQLDGIGRTIIKYPDIERIELRCEKLPDYNHDMSRRTVRGDYLTFTRSEKCDGNVGIIAFEEIKYATQERIDCGAYRIERPKNVRFSDICGLDDIIAEFRETMDYLSGKYDNSKLPPPALGFLLHGDPGVGKSLILSALSSECGIPIFFANSAVFTDAGKLDDLFIKAKKMAPSIIFLDELNAIGDSVRRPWMISTINTILAHMDGVEENSRCLVVGTTNHIDQLDAALLRPGRFTRIIHVDLPQAEAREQFIRKFESKYAFELTEQTRSYFVGLTEGKSIAVMKGVLEYALRSSVRTGQELDSQHLESAFNTIVSNYNKYNAAAIGFQRR